MATSRKNFENNATFVVEGISKYYFSIVVPLTFLALLASDISFIIKGQMVSSAVLILIGGLLALCRPALGIAGLVFLLPLLSGFIPQWNSWTGHSVKVVHHPGIDLVLGYSVMWWIQNVRRHRSLAVLNNYPTYLVWLHLFLVFSTWLAIDRNLWQSATLTNWDGFLFNIQVLRKVSWHDDFHPFIDLAVFSLGFFFVGFFRSDSIDAKEASKNVVYALILAGIVAGAYGCAQFFWKIGWFRAWNGRGVQSFIPDLHAYASFLCLPYFVSLVQYLRTSGKLSLGWAVLCLFLGVCMFMSGSRFVVIAVPVVTVTVFAVHWISSRRSGWLYALVAFLVLSVAGYTGLKKGYKGFHLKKIENTIKKGEFEHFNKLLSYRPEIYLAAGRMIADHPLFGLGQGNFNRTSALKGYSTSSFLLRKKGENAHNYFIQLLAEWGVVGFGLLFLVFMQVALGGGGLSSGRFGLWLAGAIALGNVFGHYLLIRDFFLLSVLLLVSQIRPSLWKLELSTPLRRLGYLLAALFFAGLFVEVPQSYSHEPFVYGRKCYVDKDKGKDGWTDGDYSITLPQSEVDKVIFKYSIGNKDLKVEPLRVDFYLKSSSELMYLHTATHVKRGEKVVELQIPFRKRWDELVVRMSRCHVPKNWTQTGDPRHLGIVIRSIDYL